MAHILTVTSGLPSLRYPSIELARRLATEGHRLTFAGPPEDRGLARHHGLAFLPLDASRYDQFLEADARAPFIRRLRHVRSRRDRAVDSLAISGFTRALQEMAPDLVLVNGEMHEHIIAAASTGVPTVLLNFFVSIWRQRGLPPPHTLARPGIGWAGSPIGMSLLWVALRLKKWRKVKLQWLRRVGCDRRSILRHLARRSGFDLRHETDESQWLIPFTYRRLRVLSLHALEFEFPHRPPDGVHYVGPMVLESRIDRTIAEPAQAALTRVLERHRHPKGDRRLIFASFGSAFSTDLDFLRRLLGVVTPRPDWEMVISLGGRLAPTDVGPLPERVHVFPWVPQVTVLQHADVAVTHGGINTVDECVLNGVPMLVYCGFETDMAGTTARVVHHGIGLAGDRRRDTTDRIRAHIDRLLQEPHFESALQDLRRCYVAYADERVAERTVEAILDRRLPQALAHPGLSNARSREVS